MKRLDRLQPRARAFLRSCSIQTIGFQSGPDARSFAMPSAGSRKNASLAKSIHDAIDDALLFYRCEDGVRRREHKTASDRLSISSP
jgi:hypothetical protein